MADLGVAVAGVAVAVAAAAVAGRPSMVLVSHAWSIRGTPMPCVGTRWDWTVESLVERAQVRAAGGDHAGCREHELIVAVALAGDANTRTMDAESTQLALQFLG